MVTVQDTEGKRKIDLWFRRSSHIQFNDDYNDENDDEDDGDDGHRYDDSFQLLLPCLPAQSNIINIDSIDYCC